MSKLISESVSKVIFRMAVPMLAGTFAMTMYNLANTWFVSMLGTEALAAISFSFPVVMFLMFIIRGLGTGSMTLVAHALGEKNQAKAAALTTHALMLSFFVAIVIAVLGRLTIVPVFSALGASGEVLLLTEHYMKIWYWGTGVMVLHIVASDVIISSGNTRAVSMLMVGSTLLKVVVDIVFIFGKLGMPKMGIAGAALATILAQGAGLSAALYILARRMKVIDLRGFRLLDLWVSWSRILKFSLPGSVSMILTPISSAVITWLVAGYGNAAVAAMGVAVRIELFAFMIPMTVGMSLIPFIAQNYGAGRMDRIMTARKGTMIFAVLYGVFIGLAFIFFAKTLAGFFSKEKAVVDILCSYIYITCMGYGLLEVHRYAGFVLTGIHKPFHSLMLNFVRVAVLLIPFSIAGRLLSDLDGIFWGRLAADLLAGASGIWWSGRMLRASKKSEPEPEPKTEVVLSPFDEME